jgi:hypothetical protein
MAHDDLDVGRVHAAFSPAQEIQDPQLFVGRQTEVEKGIAALLNPGGFLAIFGLRGVGKSSIAYQLKLIAEGNTEVPNLLKLQRLLPRKSFNFLVHYVRVDKFVKNCGDLFKRVLFGDDSNPSLFSLTRAGDKKLDEFKRVVSVEGGGGLFGVKLGAKGQEETTYGQYVSDDLIQQFRQLLGTIRRDNQDRTGLLILIDEFDTLADKQGFASIVKACSTDFVRFGVVGIATSVGELVRDHESIGRQIELIPVPLMPKEELELILRRAEFRVDHRIAFDPAVRDEIATRSEGYPYFTHLLGKEGMLLAFKRNSPRITTDDVKELARSITDGRLSTIYEDLYHAAVKHSPQRELLLKVFAEDKRDEIPTEPVYALAKDLGVTNPAQLMQELTRPESGAPVLTKVRERYYRFTDPVFKVYARMRQWKQ